MLNEWFYEGNPVPKVFGIEDVSNYFQKIDLEVLYRLSIFNA